MPILRRIRGGSGLGDAMYLRPFAEYFAERGDPVTVCCNFPEIFRGLKGCAIEGFSRKNINVLAHYVLGKENPRTNQWQDICASARVSIPMRAHWVPQGGRAVCAALEGAGGRPIILVHGGRVPMGRKDGFGSELLPQRAAFEAALSALGGCFLVGVGRGDVTYPLPVHLDLDGKTAPDELFDLASVAAGMVGQCSWAVPLAELMDLPLLAVWASAGMRSRWQYVAQITPAKILSKPSSRYVVDNWDVDRIVEVVNAMGWVERTAAVLQG
jgi:hypothetical protein